MKTPPRCLLLVLAIVLVTSGGCWFGTGSTSDVRYEFSRQTGVELEPEFGVKLGRVATRFGRIFARDADSDVPKLKGVNRVEMGVYTVTSVKGVRGDLRDIELPGYVPLVRVREDGEEILVLVKPEEEKVPAMLVLIPENEELVVVRLKGKLHKFLKENLDEVFEGIADLGEAVEDVPETVLDVG
jgi:hypothetical protein